MNYLKNTKTRYFLAGFALGTVGIKVLKSKPAREFYTNVLAQGMKLKANAETALEKMKEDAEDICYESKEFCKKDETAPG